LTIRSRAAATLFGYEVSFSGVGTPQNALNESPGFLDENPQFRDLGYCTQIAIFIRPEAESIEVKFPPTPGTFEVILDRHYPRNIWDEYPPSPDTLARRLGELWRSFRPQFVYEPVRDIIPAPCSAYFGATYEDVKDHVCCNIPISKLWDYNYSTQKLFRFNKDVYLEVGNELEHKEYDYGMHPTLF
jgi:hypothetical protein